MKYFTSDTHFYHKMCCEKFRPFETIEEMNEIILVNWNRTVQPNDEIYILGDFSFGNSKQKLDVLKRLNGKKYLINGNHDNLNKEHKSYFEWVKDYFKLKYQGKTFILCHYPIYSWDKKEYGSIHLHGHTHDNSHDDFKHPNKINVGVDVNNFKPLSIDEIIKTK